MFNRDSSVDTVTGNTQNGQRIIWSSAEARDICFSVLQNVLTDFRTPPATQLVRGRGSSSEGRAATSI